MSKPKLRSIFSLVQAFDERYFDHINLVASENISSPEVRFALQSDLNHRYLIPPADQRHPAIWEYPNQAVGREIARRTTELACKIFHAGAADVSPLSGNQIALAMLTGLLEKGDTFLSVGGNCGGHFTTDEISQSVIRQQLFRRLDIPYHMDKGAVNVDATARLVKKTGAKLIFLDASMILFPYPVRELRKAVGDDVIISYDASHTLGIIGGGKFQSPLQEGADFLHGSTHKSLWGPQKGIILAAKSAQESEVSKKIFSRMVPLFVSNAHPHHIAALGIALEETGKFGRLYAKDVITNARIMGRELTRRGLNVAFADQNYTQCHQLIVKIGTKEQAYDAFGRLEKAHLNVNAIRVPYAPEGLYGLRIGLSEITRRGMHENVTVQVANLVADAVLKERSVSAIRKDVMAVSKAHATLEYTYRAGPRIIKTPAAAFRNPSNG